MKTNKLIATATVAACSLAMVTTSLSEHKDKDQIKDKDKTARDQAYDATAIAPANSALLSFNKASELIGMNVKSTQDEKLGEVKDLILDLHSGRVAYAIVSSGGILGIGDKLVAVPARSFEYSAADKKLVLNVDKQTFANAPRFDKDHWPDMNDLRWNTEVYQHYGQHPYWSERNVSDRENVRFGTDKDRLKKDDSALDTKTDVDNTKRNIRDRDGRTLTPDDQGGSQADREITRQIRKSVLDKSTKEVDSVNARNIKIMTVNGTVTLRGVVESEAEKDAIEARAKNVAGVTRVDNQLEVKTK